ncbi:MAG: hypothetical protein ACLP59_26810 [Bryobacteraceae bacterium]
MDRRKLKIVMASLVAGPILLNGALALWGSIAYHLHSTPPASSAAVTPSAPQPEPPPPAVTSSVVSQVASEPPPSRPLVTEQTTPREPRPPRSPELEAKFTIVRNLSTGGNYAEALRMIDEILSTNPGNREAQQLKTQVQTGLNNATSAHTAKAAELYGLGLLPDALQECDRALALDPGNSAAAALRSKIARALEIIRGN